MQMQAIETVWGRHEYASHHHMPAPHLQCTTPTRCVMNPHLLPSLPVPPPLLDLSTHLPPQSLDLLRQHQLIMMRLTGSCRCRPLLPCQLLLQGCNL